LARKPSRRPGRYCIRRSRVLTSVVSWLMSCPELAQTSAHRHSAGPGQELKGCCRKVIRVGSWAMLAAGRELSRWRVTMCCPGAWVRFQRRKVAYRVAAVLALLLHDDAQAKADRACFLRVPGRGQPRAHPFQVVIGEPVDDAAYHPHAGAAYFQHLCQRRARVEVDAERCGVCGREAGLREAERVVRHRLIENHVAGPLVGGEDEMAQRLDEGPFAVDPLVQGRFG
jgi:hypothetical protein